MDKKNRSKKTTQAKASVSKKKVAPNVTADQIALRAYFIGERRRQLGWSGDEVSDWVDAEKQLLTEAAEQPIKKK